MLRTVLIGPTHWHLPLYLEPMLERDDLEYVGVADPDLAAAQKVADRLVLDGICQKARADEGLLVGDREPAR